MSVNYIRELPEKIKLSEPPTYKPANRRHREVRLSRYTFEQLGDYTRSVPTAPSEGRIYKKNFGWPARMKDNWFVFIVINSPDGKGQLHVPYTPVFTPDTEGMLS